MAARSGGKLQLAVVDPQPFSEDEDRATAMGLQAVPLGNTGDSLFFITAGSNAVGQEAAILFFQPDKEAFLEYDVAKLVSSPAQDARPVVGLMTTLAMGRASIHPPDARPSGWVIESEMRNLFDVRHVEPTARSIDTDIKALVVVHPRHLSPDTLLRHRPVRAARRPPPRLRRSERRTAASRRSSGPIRPRPRSRTSPPTCPSCSRPRAWPTTRPRRARCPARAGNPDPAGRAAGAPPPCSD